MAKLKTRNPYGNIFQHRIRTKAGAVVVWDIRKRYTGPDGKPHAIAKRCHSYAEALQALAQIAVDPTALKREHAHGLTHSITYSSYRKAKYRCENPRSRSYKWYGALGTEFRFNSVTELIEEIGERPSKEYSLDRKDPFGHYERGNVRWATRQQQAETTRRAVLAARAATAAG